MLETPNLELVNTELASMHRSSTTELEKYHRAKDQVKEICGKIIEASETEEEGSSDDRVVDQLSEDDESSSSSSEDFYNEEDEEAFADSNLCDSSPEAEHNKESHDEIIKNSNDLFWELSEKMKNVEKRRISMRKLEILKAKKISPSPDLFWIHK
ncbi:hypothetical protein L2E82_31092 [Cichorium intybus]|uniref:Uncharacterized protein n=1 Tax=Cichorium intybus TaxID=13427 RepID=A0ACB9D2U8_CICIN|nr:hypothetical protein L2E82_31092 [Cichorium intybus]